MARSKKQARHIVVKGVPFLWRATGNDEFIDLAIWPEALEGRSIHTTFRYHETWLPRGDGSYRNAGDQIVVTNRLVRRVIERAIEKLAYDPTSKGTPIEVRDIEKQIEMHDAIRGKRSV